MALQKTIPSPSIESFLIFMLILYNSVEFLIKIKVWFVILKILDLTGRMKRPYPDTTVADISNLVDFSQIY